TELERRRIRAVELLGRGESPGVLARILGVTTSSLHRWRRQAREEGGLAAKPVAGPKPLLSDVRLRELEGLLRKGATAHGWVTDLWTATRVATLIQRHFGIRFHPEHVRKILKRKLNWSSQRPQRQHPDGNDSALTRWIEDVFPRILGEAVARNAHLAFVDESGFMLNPLVRRTFAPRGQTPVNRVADPHARISAIAAITVDPRRERVAMAYDMLGDNANFRGPGVASFVHRLL